MLAFVKRRSFVVFIALLLIALLIYFFGDWLSIGPADSSWQPLGPERTRLILIALLFFGWLLWIVIGRIRARRANAQLASAVVKQAPVAEQVSPEAAKLRELFEKAVATLNTGGSGRSLYDLPWYIFIGAPGSGKTTALINSGLRFPLEQRVGKRAVRGVGGTRNCDWWFTDDAVFLDTAGRYTTQDSDATSDAEGWREFLALLRKYRRRRPINGVVLTLSAQDLLTQSEDAREAHLEAAQRRLSELATELRIELPVYVMVTKCDVVAGFTEYFDDLPLEGRQQVWGVTFPYERSLAGNAAGGFQAEFDALMERLSTTVYQRVEEARGPRRRASAFAFPQQMAALGEPIASFLTEVFASGRLERQILLRGVYLTSGTQDGTQVDRLLGAIGRRFGIAPDAVAPGAGKGKAYFVERLLREVVIAESGLAGIDRRFEAQSALRQFGAYAAVALIVAMGVLVWTLSFIKNRDYIDQLRTDVHELEPDHLRRASTSVTPELLLPRFDALRKFADAANKYEGHVPWSMRWGLYQGGSLGHAARSTYLLDLDTWLLPRFADRVKQHLLQSASEPERLFSYLKAYLMFKESRHFDADYLQKLADVEWPRTAVEASGGASLATHLAKYFEYRRKPREIPIDTGLVAQAQGNLRRTSMARIMYEEIKQHYEADSSNPPLRLDQAGLGIDRVLYRRSGRNLAEPVSALYTQPVFKEVTSTVTTLMIAQYGKDSWVWGSGGGGASILESKQLRAQVTDLYEHDYIKAWQAQLDDLDVRPVPTVTEYVDALQTITTPPSPLTQLVKAVVLQTKLTAPAAPGAAQAAASSVLSQLKDRISNPFGRAAADAMLKPSGPPPGTAVTLTFAPLDQATAGAPAPIDAALDQAHKIQQHLAALSLPGASPLATVTDKEFFTLLGGLRDQARALPSPVNRWFAQLAQVAGETIRTSATSELQDRYRAEVVTACHSRIDGKYPFASTSNDVPLADFAAVFGPDGVYARFFTERLDKLVDTSRRPWTVRPEAPAIPENILDQFQAVAEIRETFFTGGSKTPKVPFVLQVANLEGPNAVTRFYMDLEGQRVAIKPGEQTQLSLEWPAPQSTGRIETTFEDRIAQPVPVDHFYGAWAWFRFIDYRLDPGHMGAAGDLTTHLLVKSPQQVLSSDHSAVARRRHQSVCEPQLAHLRVRIVIRIDRAEQSDY